MQNLDSGNTSNGDFVDSKKGTLNSGKFSTVVRNS